MIANGSLNWDSNGTIFIDDIISILKLMIQEVDPTEMEFKVYYVNLLESIQQNIDELSEVITNILFKLYRFLMKFHKL